ncbi:MAG: hypothetical protein ACLP01_18315 [Solirubrobacteraceae bacterium]
MLASTLHSELVALGFDRSYPTLVREIRELGLHPEYGCCKAGAVKLMSGLEHEPGEELQQLHWLELSETPWSVAGVCAGRRVVALGQGAWLLLGGESNPAPGRGAGWCAAPAERHHALVADGSDGDVVDPGTERLRPHAAAIAKHYGVVVAVCPARRPQHKGSWIRRSTM